MLLGCLRNKCLVYFEELGFMKVLLWEQKFDYLMKNGVITDWREPNVIRLAPVPLYTSYVDMYNFGQILKAGIVKV